MQNFIEEVTLCYSLIYGFTSHVLSYINHLYKRSKHKFVNDYEAHMPRGVCENRYFPKQVAEPCTKTDFLHNAIHLQKKKSRKSKTQEPVLPFPLLLSPAQSNVIVVAPEVIAASPQHSFTTLYRSTRRRAGRSILHLHRHPLPFLHQRRSRDWDQWIHSP